MAKPKIVFVSRKWPPAVGGMETYAVRLSDALREHGDLTVIALPGRTDGQPPSGVAIIGFGVRAFFRLLTRDRDADLIHIADMASWPVALARPGLPVVLSAHGTDVSYPLRDTLKARLYGFYLRLGSILLKRALVVTNSATTDAQTRSFGFVKTRIVPLATDITRQSNSSPTDRLLFSGRLTPRKGLAWFVNNVLDGLPEEVQLDVAGTVWDDAEARALEHPRVRHLGHLDPQEIARAYASALAVVVPNIAVPTREFEGFGLVAVEGAAAGGVVLASHHGGLREAVRDGETGFLLPPEEAEAWVDAILRVRNWSPEDRAAFTDKASSVASRFYNWDRVAADTAAIYAEAIEGRTR